MENKFIAEAYKPAEKLAFNYLMLRDTLSRLLKEQKFPAALENALFKVYKNFQLNADNLISLYQKVPNVLALDKLLDNIEDETTAIFIDSGLDTPLLDEQESIPALAKFIIDVELSFLDESKNYREAIPGFNWDIESFEKAFNAIEREAMEYDE